MKILIYKDFGCSINSTFLIHSWLKKNLPLFDILFTDSSEIINDDILKNAKALFIPGGHSRAYQDKLKGKGNLNIKKFVEDGGLYYGICAGGYYPCKNIEFKGKELSINKTNSDLVFFNGLAKGSIKELANNSYYDETIHSSNAVKISFCSDYTYAYYNGGAIFKPYENTKYNVLARYEKLEYPDNIAIIDIKIKKGSAILAGIHPEFDDKSFLDGVSRDYLNKIKKIKLKLENNSNKEKFTKHILAKCLHSDP